MASYDTTINWVLFVLGIFIFAATAFITAMVARFRPCCLTKTVADPESDTLVTRGMQTDTIEEEEKDTMPEDVVYVTKHSNNTFSIHDRKRSSIITNSFNQQQQQQQQQSGRVSTFPVFQNQVAPYPYPPGSAMAPPGMIIPQQMQMQPQIIQGPPGTSMGMYAPTPMFAPTPGPGTTFITTNPYQMY